MVFQYLDKTEKEYWLPQLFHLLYENMKSIAPSGLSYDEERKQWLAAVSPALEKDPRQIILCFVGEELAGYIQYYIREQMLMVEEIQLKEEHQRTFLFYGLCKYLMSVIPDNLKTIEAYADWRNANSIRLMEKLGMETCDPETGSCFVHMRGSAESVCLRFKHGDARRRTRRYI